MNMYMSADNVRPLGELGARTALLFGRMTDAIYRPEAIFTGDQNGWPGDWEGRAILAQTLLSRIMGVESPYLKANVTAIKGELNEKGYLKYIMPEGEFNEQQLSGHGWLIRGLCEYYEYSGDETALDMAKTICKNLFMPTAGHFADYPIDPKERGEGGRFAGNIAAVVRGWHVSTDTGCAFIPMDGLSRLFSITRDPALGALLDEMHERFMSIDVVGSRVQTHATLSACRGIIRLYAITGAAKYLESGIKLFDIYVNNGMTANYANYNWFGRPEWTEPCAIIDSYIVAMRLYQYTGEVFYADIGRRIWANGIGRSQRPNGGFGCDSCLGAGDDGDALSVRTYEAYWCCTMRGGEGMEKATRFSYLTKGDAITVPAFASSVADIGICGGVVRMRQNADGAREGHVVFEIEENTAQRAVSLRVLMPEWACAGSSRYAEYIVPSKGGKIVIDFDVPVYMDGRRLMWGDMMLGTKADIAKVDPASLKRVGNGFEYAGAQFAPIADSYLEDAQHIAETVRALF